MYQTHVAAEPVVGVTQSVQNQHARIQRINIKRLSFDVAPAAAAWEWRNENEAPDRREGHDSHTSQTDNDTSAYPLRLFDAAWAKPPESDAPVKLLGWHSRTLSEDVDGPLGQARRYTRLGPHLMWMVDTIVSVARSHPALPVQLPQILDAQAPAPQAP